MTSSHSKGDEDFRHDENGDSRLLQNVGICPYYLSWSCSCVLLLGAFAELAKSDSVSCLSAWNSAPPTVRNFMKFGILDYLSRKYGFN